LESLADCTSHLADGHRALQDAPDTARFPPRIRGIRSVEPQPIEPMLPVFEEDGTVL
jgi:hypothetical protein